MTPSFSRLAIAALLSLAPAGAAHAATLEQMAGQMIVVGFQGDEADDASVEALRAELAAGRLGGVMLLKTNVKGLGAVAEMNAAFRAASPDLPPFITVDQEGGAVERMTKDVGFTEIPNAASIAANNTPAQAKSIYSTMAASLAELGFTVNFGPVADVNLNPNNQVIAKFGRSFSADPAVVASYDAAFIDAHHQAGMLTALKHFPGHGSSTADSHEGFVDITQTWKPEELDPYRALIGAGEVDMVMVGHLYHADYSDADAQTPSSLSPQWITGVLRDELGFDGVVISDDLEMGAIRDHFTLEQTVTQAVRAGTDVLLFSNTAKYRASLGQEVLDILMAQAAADPAFAARIEASYQRIVALKGGIR
ncbi:glycoside hydrolase family 3 N-terminal domain-containing protein [Devosia sp. SL43]|uniref:glycoside hydrolase family 3 N-terminal domain-containing protein n=1 Tax=Devosia sp. SL43 TaxID=2806348 RepID=UPI001F33B483|nr:glycoside hydrolase family 3 N-terminal domain-containing protein [Devosia sp. SL43]UJW86674.1 glycoside hydrolase family 3 protein [Devosia sp. SL43]